LPILFGVVGVVLMLFSARVSEELAIVADSATLSDFIRVETRSDSADGASANDAREDAGVDSNRITLRSAPGDFSAATGQSLRSGNFLKVLRRNHGWAYVLPLKRTNATPGWLPTGSILIF